VFSAILDDVYAILNGKGVVVYRAMVSVKCLLFMHIIQSCIIYFHFNFTFRVRRALVRIIIRGIVMPRNLVCGLAFCSRTSAMLCPWLEWRQLLCSYLYCLVQYERIMVYYNTQWIKVPCYKRSLMLRCPTWVCTVLYCRVRTGVIVFRCSRCYTIIKLRSGVFQRNVIGRQGVTGRIWMA
jgi:hypothetical protein